MKNEKVVANTTTKKLAIDNCNDLNCDSNNTVNLTRNFADLVHKEGIKTMSDYHFDNVPLFEQELLQVTQLVIDDINDTSIESHNLAVNLRKVYYDRNDWFMGDALIFISYFAPKYADKEIMRRFVETLISVHLSVNSRL